MSNSAALRGYSELGDSGLLLSDSASPLPLATVDAVIFDVDGVLVMVTDSFREVISRSVQFYFNRILDVPGEERIITSEETSHFKMAGRYNNDWEVTMGALALGLLKLSGLNGAATDAAAVRGASPGVEQFTAEVKSRGGGLDNTLELVRARMSGLGMEKFEKRYQPELVRRIFMEHYAGGDLCRRLYGFEPGYHKGPGLVRNERDIVKPAPLRNLASAGVRLGILSGRTPEEADYLFERTGLDSILEPGYIVTDDGSLPGKPDPDGLALLARRMEFSAGIYVGDVPDDWYTVVNYRRQETGLPPVSCCMVRTGAAGGGLMKEFFESEPVDYVAPDVNQLLSALIAARSGGL